MSASATSTLPDPSGARPACCSPGPPDTTLDPCCQFEGTRPAVFSGFRGGHHGSRQHVPLSLDPQPASVAGPQPIPRPASARSLSLLIPKRLAPPACPPDPLPLRAASPHALLADRPASAPPVVRPTPAPRTKALSPAASCSTPPAAVARTAPRSPCFVAMPLERSSPPIARRSGRPPILSGSPTLSSGSPPELHGSPGPPEPPGLPALPSGTLSSPMFSVRPCLFP
ncbi:proline-rich receptor-like protein kinase PERK2 [Micropterus dolomieu]|uniref:proline-rich receptor-like protein kinase PERK2 n=1 Tax=Micropterus dolomieu TaxID=147949 RepID=UPI001E8D827C|nr:proline-rich receptor-like protein kinase PERK2 [Micropterus dolomieu]